METPEGLVAGIEDGVLSVRLSSGDGENRVTPAIRSWLTDVFDRPPPDVFALSLSADGPAFCLGPQPAGPGGSVRELGRSLTRLNRALSGTPLVTIAAVDGEAAGFGVGLACLPDITLAGDQARFVFPEINRGLSPALVLSWLSDFVGPKAASWLTLTGYPFGAGYAQELGLVTEAVASSALPGRVTALLDHFRAMDRVCLLEIRRFLRDRRGMVLRAAEELAVERMGAWSERQGAVG